MQAVAGDFPPGADPERNAGPAYSIGGAVNGMMWAWFTLMNPQPKTQVFDVTAEHCMLELARRWAQQLNSGDVVHLLGDLGAGKTTFVRGVLQGLGHHGPVTSPTYTLVEIYHLPPWQVFHLDLYRLNRAHELELIGLRDMMTRQTVMLVEWPEKGQGVLPPADYTLQFDYTPTGRRVAIRLADGVAGRSG